MTEVDLEHPERVPLPGGAWVVLGDTAGLLIMHRKKILYTAEKAAGSDESAMRKGISVIEGCIALAVTDWSLALPLPSATVASLDSLTPAQWDALAKLAEPWRTALFGENFSPSPEPDSPTEPSVD